MKLYTIWFGFVIGNLITAALTSSSVSDAAERSYFQGIALLVVHWTSRQEVVS